MTAFRHWLATLSVFAFGGATQSYVQPAEAKVTAAEIERACENALQANSIEALENFLHKYPPGKYRNEVACYALALGALNEFNGTNGNEGNDRGRGDPTTRGKPSDGGGGGGGSGS
jgi:hypothetical protein